MSIFELMAAPFAECMVLVGIHTYLGIHVLRRRVIFVDLALAQVAALGTMVGFLFGILPDPQAKLDYMEELSGQCRRGALRLLHIYLSDPATPAFFRAEGQELLKELAGQDFGYDPDLAPAQNSAALDLLKTHQEGLPRGAGADCDLEC